MIPPFKLEEFWKKYEFSAPYLLCPSDTESWELSEILELADPEVRRLWDKQWLGYTDTAGLPLLREEIAKLYSPLQADEVLTFAGAQEAIYCLMRSLLLPKDHVIVVTPCYQSLLTLPQIMGADVTEVPLDPNDNWKLSIQKLQEAFRPTTKLLVINYPHNPTGTLLSLKVWEEVVSLANRCGAYIFNDEVYRYLEVNESDRLASVVDAYERGISLNVMSKAFGLAGLRVGWLASHDREVLKKVGAYKLYTSICNSVPSEILALMALRGKAPILKRNREIMLNNLKLLDLFFEPSAACLSWTRPQSGPIALAKLLLPLSIDSFTEELIEKAGILVMPGSVLDLPGPYFRIGFGRKNMPEVLHRFDEFLKSI